MTFDIIIPNYNGFDLIQKNLPKIIDSIKKYKDWKIIIIDDYSDKSDFENLEYFISKLNQKNIILLRNSKNLGFSSTVNRGVESSIADLIVLLNTDVAPYPNFLDPVLTNFESNKNLFGVGFLDVSIEEEKKVLRGRGLASWKRGFLVHRKGEVDQEDTFWISGGSSIVRRDLFNEIEGFDNIYNPFYWEDIDLSYRARKSGYDIKFDSRCIVEHRHQEGSIKKHYGNIKIKTIAYRNQLIFIWKNITDFNLILSHIIWLPYHFAKALIRVDFSFFLGFLIAIFSLPAIIDKRFKQKSLYKKKDSDLI